MDHGSRHMEGRGRGAAHGRAAFVQRRALMRYGARTQNISEESPLRRHSHQSL